MTQQLYANMKTIKIIHTRQISVFVTVMLPLIIFMTYLTLPASLTEPLSVTSWFENVNSAGCTDFTLAVAVKTVMQS